MWGSANFFVMKECMFRICVDVRVAPIFMWFSCPPRYNKPWCRFARGLQKAKHLIKMLQQLWLQCILVYWGYIFLLGSWWYSVLLARQEGKVKGQLLPHSPLTTFKRRLMTVLCSALGPQRNRKKEGFSILRDSLEFYEHTIQVRRVMLTYSLTLLLLAI